MLRLFGYFNRGNANGVANSFAFPSSKGRGTAFKWFSFTETGLRHSVFFRKRDLLAYLRRRHAHHETLRLIMLDVGRGEVRQTADFTFAMTRHADDLEPGLGGEARLAGGKGALNCRRPQTIFVWSAGMKMAGQGEIFPKGEPWPSCPRPDGWDPLGGVIVACSQ